MKRTIAPALVAFALVAAACTGDTDGAQTIDPGMAPDSATDSSRGTAAAGSTTTTVRTVTGGDGGSSGPIGFAPAALQRFGECDAFLEYVHTEGAARVGAYGFGDGGWFGPVDFGVGDEAMTDGEEASGADDASEPVAPADGVATAATVPASVDAGSDGTFSTTNVQVEGVDEPDIVKTDGSRILVLADQILHYVEVSDDGTTGTRRGSIDLTPPGPSGENTVLGYGHEILVSGDRAFVIAQGDGDVGVPEPFPIDEPVLAEDVPASTSSTSTSVADDADTNAVAEGEAPTTPAPTTTTVSDGSSTATTTTTTTMPPITAGPDASTTSAVATTSIPGGSTTMPPTTAVPVQPTTTGVPSTTVVPDESTTSAVPPTTDVAATTAVPTTTTVPDEPPPPTTTVVPPLVEPPLMPGAFVGPTTVVYEVDLSDPDELRVANTMTIDGRYISARAIGRTARIAVTSPPRDLGFLYPSNPSAEESAAEFNRDLVAESTLDDWIPTYTLTAADGASDTGDLVSCDRIHAPSEFAGFDMLSIVTVDLTGPLAPPTGTSAVMAAGDTVYASQDRMYVSTSVWLPPTVDERQRGVWEENYETGIHRFSIAGDGPAEYEASGSIEGHLLNQFSMNDRDGTLYAATTTGSPWSTDGSVSQIVALQADGDRLVPVGEVGGLGQGERIFSVRYVGDLAYVVTFRQTDPFYVVDLADPANMAVRGELKIPGFSSYLHPITPTLVLGVGQDATDEGLTTGTKVSLFDVTDPSNPQEVDVWTMPNAGSDAEFDHRAFLYWAPTGQAVLPVTNWNTGFSGAVVLNIRPDGIAEQGTITHVPESGDQIGVTDCEVLTLDGVTEADGELFWIAREVDAGRTQLQLCEPGDVGGATGFSYCDPIPVDQVDQWFGIGEDGGTFTNVTGLDVNGFERVEWCWKEPIDFRTQIRRTLVIDGQLWSFSLSRLQANALADLAVTSAVDL